MRPLKTNKQTSCEYLLSIERYSDDSSFLSNGRAIHLLFIHSIYVHTLSFNNCALKLDLYFNSFVAKNSKIQ